MQASELTFGIEVAKGWEPVGEPVVEYFPSKGSIISGTAW